MKTPVLGIAAYSGSGKTTLLTAVIPLLKQQGFKLGVIKHAHHHFDIDEPGKDSYQLRKAGADMTMVASDMRRVLITEHSQPKPPDYGELARQLDDAGLDLILIEGFKHTEFPKIEVHRPALGLPMLFAANQAVIAIATDQPTAVNTDLPILDMNQPAKVAEFMVTYIRNAT